MAEGKPVPIRFSVETISRLDTAAKKIGITRSAMIRMLIEKWLDHFEQHGSASLPSDWNRALHSRDSDIGLGAIHEMGTSVGLPEISP